MNDARGGLAYEEITAGGGDIATRGSRVTVRYDLALRRGEVVQREQAVSFVVGARDVFAGLEYGVDGMRVGGTRRLRVPPHLGYRDDGVAGVIPPNALLIVDVTLLAVEPRGTTRAP